MGAPRNFLFVLEIAVYFVLEHYIVTFSEVFLKYPVFKRYTFFLFLKY